MVMHHSIIRGKHRTASAYPGQFVTHYVTNFAARCSLTHLNEVGYNQSIDPHHGGVAQWVSLCPGTRRTRGLQPTHGRRKGFHQDNR